MVARRLTMIPGEGSFVINRLRDEDEGVYECRASNDNGTKACQLGLYILSIVVTHLICD